MADCSIQEFRSSFMREKRVIEDREGLGVALGWACAGVVH